MRRRVWFVWVVMAVGCETLPAFITVPAANMTPVVGGISNTNPFFGTFRLNDAPDQDTGIFLLASCGCGDWRVLFKPYDGSRQTQFPVLFYAEGEYAPTGSVAFHGVEDANAASGVVMQDTGTAEGRAELETLRVFMNGVRDNAHDQAVEACGLCHVGEDSVYPLPPSHPDKYKSDPTVCFECHTVNGQ